MDKGLLITLLALTLGGGILGNLAPGIFMRSRRGRSFVCGWKWWGVLLYFLAVGAVVTGVVAWTYISLVADREAAGTLDSPLFFFTFGLAAGLPFSLTTLLSVRRQDRIAKERSRRKKPASRQERLDFAKNLEEQLREFSDDLKEARVKVKGKESTVVAFHGGVTREQAERLANALRADLLDLGIQRLESGDEGENWWVRVR